jgi:hypothetical protein
MQLFLSKGESFSLHLPAHYSSQIQTLALKTRLGAKEEHWWMLAMTLMDVTSFQAIAIFLLTRLTLTP